MHSVFALGLAHLPLDPRHRLGGKGRWSLGPKRPKRVAPFQTAANHGRPFRLAPHPDQEFAFDLVGVREVGSVADAREEGACFGERGSGGVRVTDPPECHGEAEKCLPLSHHRGMSANRPDVFAVEVDRKAPDKAPGPIALTWYQTTRHSFVTRNLEAGVSLDEVSAAIGHSSPMVTKRYYDHHMRKTFSATIMAGLKK